MSTSVSRALAVALLFIPAGSAFAAPTKPASAPSPNERIIRAAKQSVRVSLKDPASAQFSNIRVYSGEKDGEKVVCGRVNAKNSYGGYTGAAPFMVRVFYDGKEALGVARLGDPNEEARVASYDDDAAEVLDFLSVSGQCRRAAERSSKP